MRRGRAVRAGRWRGCGGDDSGGGGSAAAAAAAATRTAKVAFVYPTTTTNFAQEMALGAKAAADDTPGVKLTEAAPAEVDGPKQVQLFQAADAHVQGRRRDDDPDARPVHPAAPAGRGAQNVPLVAVDVPPPKGTENAVKLLIGNSNVEIGQRPREGAARRRSPKDAKGEILIGTDTPGLPVLEQRNQGFKDVMKKERPGVTFLVFDAKQSPTDNFNTWSAQVKAHPDAVAYVGPGSQAAVSLTRIQRKQRPRSCSSAPATSTRSRCRASRTATSRRSSRPSTGSRATSRSSCMADAKQERQGRCPRACGTPAR